MPKPDKPPGKPDKPPGKPEEPPVEPVEPPTEPTEPPPETEPPIEPPTEPTDPPTQPPISGGGMPPTDAVAEFGFVGDGEADNAEAWAKALDAVANNRCSPWLDFHPGLYAIYDTEQLCGRNVDFLRITGPTPPIYNQYPTPERSVAFIFKGNEPVTMFDADPGEGTIQSGVYFEYLSFFNAGHPDAVAVSISRVNNWRLIRTGCKGFAANVFSEAQPDNAHGAMIDTIIDIPSGKCGARIVGNPDWQSPGAGFAIRGGSWSGEIEAIGLLGEKWADSCTLGSDLKIDGCSHGAVVWAGKNLSIYQLRIEGGGDPSHPMIDIQHDGSFQNSGRGNIMSHLHMIGRGNGELLGRFAEGSFLNSVSHVYAENAGVGEWIDDGHDNYVETASIMS